MTKQLRRKLTIVQLLIYWPALFIVAHIPVPRLVYQARVSDKSIHFICYLALTFLFWFALNPNEKIRWNRAKVWWILLAVVWYGVIDEVLQRYVGRSPDIKDFTANVIGVGTALAIMSFFYFWPALVIVNGIVLFFLSNLAKANLYDLVPATNALFHIFGYAFFVMAWMRTIYIYRYAKTGSLKWIFFTLGLAFAVLGIVKTGSIIVGKKIIISDMVFATIGIVVPVVVGYLISVYRKKADQKLQVG